MKTKKLIKIRSYTAEGFSLVEMLVYIAILSIMVSSLVMTSVSLLTTFGRLVASEDIAQASVVSLERITRELRFANAVDVGASTLGTTTSPGVLVLNTIDDGGSPTTVTVTLTGDRITFAQGGGATSPLTHDTVIITDLFFIHTAGVNTEAINVSFTASRTVRGTTISKDFRTFVVLDAS